MKDIDAAIARSTDPGGGQLFQSEWDHTEAVMEGERDKLWKPTTIEKVWGSSQVLELVFTFMTTTEFAAKFSAPVGSITEARKGQLIDVARNFGIDGVLLRPDPVLSVELDIKALLNQAGENDGKVKLAIDNSIWAYRRLIVQTTMGVGRRYTVMGPEDEFRSAQAENTWEFMVNEDSGNRIQDHLAPQLTD